MQNPFRKEKLINHRSNEQKLTKCFRTLPGGLSATETLKPLMESKVFETFAWGGGYFADLQENTDGGGRGWNDLSGGKEKNVEVVLVALMCVSMTHRLCVGCCVWAVSLLPHH